MAKRAAANGVDLWALTDHDALGGLAEARVAANECGMAFVSGVEISIEWKKVPIHIVGDQAGKKSAAIGTDDINRAHVRNVEHAEVVTNRVVLLELRTVVPRHVPATEIDHPGIHRTVSGIQNSFLQHINPLLAFVKAVSGNEKRVKRKNHLAFHPSVLDT